MALYCCSKFQRICLSLSPSKSRKNFHFLKNQLCARLIHVLYLICIQFACERQTITTETFLKKNDSYLETQANS